MWEAANAPTAVPRDDNRTETSGVGGLNLNLNGGNNINSLQQDHHQNQNHPLQHQHQHQHQHQKRPQHGDNNVRSRRVASSETIEAALSRLSKAYTTSIECIGAISKTNQMISQQKKKQREKLEAKGKRNFETLGDTDGNNQHQNNSTETDTATILNALQTIKKVSNIARTTLETAILLDPLMLPHAPILHQSMIELSNNNNPEANNNHLSRWNAVNERRPAPPTISSAAHKATLVQLAYLSLVNYSDLLQQSSGSTTTPMNTASKKSSSTPTAKPLTILDRGIVPRLKSFEGLTATKMNDGTPIIGAIDEEKNNTARDQYNIAMTTRHPSSQLLFTCWIPEDPEETQRLAVAALCDASNLDGTDPITWLKLACASRQLERIVAEGLQQKNGEIMTTVERSQHRRLQRRALERGSIALPKHMPPNRTVLRALEEFFRGPEINEYHSGGLSTASTRTKVCKKTMELTRYSWSVLGKMIIRACKGEEFTAPWDISSSSIYNNNNNNNMCNSPLSLFGSPTVVIKLSSMLVLPSKVLGKICQYLENTSIWKFEATCRALSVNIIAARASMEESESNRDDDDDDDDKEDAADLLLQRQERRQKEQLRKIQHRTPQDHEQSGKNRKTAPLKDIGVDGHDKERVSTVEEQSNEETNANNNNSDSIASTNAPTTKSPKPIVRQSSRTSQRLRSKEISTGKKQDREAKRNSFDYCFLAATLSCTKKKHDELADELLKKKEFDYLFRGNEDKSLESGSSGRRKGYSSQQNFSNEGSNTNYVEAVERISDASLSSFVNRWSSKNSGPMELLERYLAHVALFAEDVFASDSPTMGLHSCILSSFQSLLLRSGSHPSIVPRFFQPMIETGSFLQTLEFFAMDLLHAELIFRQCDRYSPKIVEFDDDANLISLMIPSLVESCNEMKKDINAQHKENKIDSGLCTKFYLLEIRCYWLTASFYLWRSRVARAIYLSREAEDEGIHFIGMTINGFNSPFLQSIKSVKTPHLISPGRQGSYWREISPISLSKFRDEIEASSVVSHARQRFQELVSSLKKEENPDGTSTDISTDDANVLSEIGQKLYERYNSQYGSSDSKLSELVDNFLEMCGGNILLHQNAPESSQLSDEVLIQLEPYKVEDLQRVSNPTILSMLVICLNMDEENRLCVGELLVRLVLATVDIHRSLLKQIRDFRATRKQTDGYNSDDAMSDSDDDMSDCGPHSSQKDDDEKKARQCGHFIIFLINCLFATLQSKLTEDERTKLLVSDEFSDMIKSALDFSNQWFQSTVRYLSIPCDTVDRDLVRLVQKILIESQKVEAGTIITKKIELVFFRGLIQIIISQYEVLKSLATSQVDRSHRTARQRLCINRAEYIGRVASELGGVLSLNLAYVDNFVIRKGPLFERHDFMGRKKETSEVLTYEEEIIFIRAVRWLRKYAFQDDGESVNSNQANTSNSFDRPIIKELKIPISALIIGICGSSSCSRQCGNREDSFTDGVQESCNLSLTEFFDSDASMNDWQSESEEESKSEKSKKELVRVICHSIHCIVLIFEKVDEKDVVNRFLEVDCNDEFGPILPLVAARVLNFFADTLLLNFGDDEADGKNRKNLWSEEYPFHTKYTGQLLDTALHKTYRWMYGFALVGEQNHQLNAGSELSHSMNHISEIADKSFRLESTVAAGQLYRCIIRAYAGGRRTPPKQALEFVSAALPPLRESEQSKALRRFAFSGDNIDLDINSLLNMDEQWDSPFQIVRDSIIQNKDSLDESGNTSLEELEAMQVRRGLSQQLSLGPLPIVSSDPKSKSEAGADDDRLQTMCNERAITKKFNAILDDLCLSNADNWEGWYRASQCCALKAESIADRLGLTLGFSRIKNFSVPAKRGTISRTLNIIELQIEQEHEERMSKQVRFFGDDYSVYMNNAWSSISSLRDCVATMKKRNSVNNETSRSRNRNIPFAIWKEIDSKYDTGNFLEWQEACGGIFVKALRNLSIRFMCVALYILQSKAEINSDHKVLLSDVCETLGNNFYSELMASQNYGWPMLVMTTKRKRDLADMAKSSFQASIKHADDSVGEDDDIDDHSTWDLLFMVGKCHEKIAGTYNEESFEKQTENSPQKTRLYETHMGKAMLTYAKALAEANKLEDAGSQLLDQAGGSGHGSTEILYRLHASRLKCLIQAVSRNEEEREQAEMEASRLTEKYRFKDREPECNTLHKDLRKRIWTIFSDVVDGLSECRKLKPFFHRSVFRHAQALMWSPVFFDPSSSKTSMDSVPIRHGCQIRGLDCSKPAAFSAKDVISTLFDKKRTQLCAVWVTNSGAASPFQAMNSSIRKYDSLRGKYIGAYLETLHLCNRRSEVETFLKWLYTSRRDRPSHFTTSAINGGDKPTVSHTQDPLLIMDSSSNLMLHGFLLSSKRHANSVLADILMKEMSKIPSGAVSKPSPSSDGMKESEYYLKNAYACYLRLNCSIEDLKSVRAFKYGSDSIREVDAMCQAYLSLGDATQDGLAGSDFGDWSGGGRKLVIFKQALSECKTLFPSLSASTFFGKSKVKKGRGSQTAAPDPDESQNPRKGGSKRKSQSSNNSSSTSGTPSESLAEENTKKVSFEVAVPTGLKSGDTFLTSVNVVDSQPIKVKLTVPEGQHSTLRFNLNVPRSSPTKGRSKKAKVSS